MRSPYLALVFAVAASAIPAARSLPQQGESTRQVWIDPGSRGAVVEATEQALYITAIDGGWGVGDYFDLENLCAGAIEYQEGSGLLGGDEVVGSTSITIPSGASMRATVASSSTWHVSLSGALLSNGFEDGTVSAWATTRP